jgi:hypothetical protein
MGESLIPSGACVRIRLDKAVESFLSKLAEQLQSNAEGVFFAQQDPRAGLGCCPFHIKIISSVNLTGESCQTISSILHDVASTLESVQGHVLPVCTVDSVGLVSLKISSSDCLLIGKHLSHLLPGANSWSSRHESHLSVSIGSFQGPHTTAFENWLNGELTSNSSVFPIFYGDILELSEGGQNFIQKPAKLSGKELKEIEPTHVQEIHTKVERNDIKSKTSLTSGTTEVVPFVSPISEKSASFGQRLLTSAATVIQKIEGSGTIKMESNPLSAKSSTTNNPLKNSIFPSDMVKWQDQCSKLFTMLDRMLQAVGHKVKLSLPIILINPIHLLVPSFYCHPFFLLYLALPNLSCIPYQTLN